MFLTVAIPLAHYDRFVGLLEPTSRAAELLKNACFFKEPKDHDFDRFMAVCCKEDELDFLIELANRLYPDVVQFLSETTQ